MGLCNRASKNSSNGSSLKLSSCLLKSPTVQILLHPLPPPPVFAAAAHVQRTGMKTGEGCSDLPQWTSAMWHVGFLSSRESSHPQTGHSTALRQMRAPRVADSKLRGHVHRRKINCSLTLLSLAWLWFFFSKRCLHNSTRERIFIFTTIPNVQRDSLLLVFDQKHLLKYSTLNILAGYHVTISRQFK